MKFENDNGILIVIQDDVWYSMSPFSAAVIIHRRSIGNILPMDERSCRAAIENVKNEREYYATPDAWEREIEIREDALKFLLGCMKRIR